MAVTAAGVASEEASKPGGRSGVRPQELLALTGLAMRDDAFGLARWSSSISPEPSFGDVACEGSTEVGEDGERL